MTSGHFTGPCGAAHGGQPSLRKRIEKRAKRLLGLSRPYQLKRVEGTEQRWEMIAAQLGPEDRNLLDVGCNLGTLTRRAADRGLLALGIDIDPDFIRRAKLRHRNVPNLSFMCLPLDPESIARLPEFDVSLCLSVHHHWVKQYGLERSWEMVRTLLSRTRRRLFFEPASIRKKYRADAPEIVDLDRESIIETTVRQLSAAGSTGHTVRCLGETPCLGLEPFRVLFVVEGS